MSQRDDRIHAFADFEVDLATREIRRAGGTVAVEPQVFDLIALLITHRGEVVTKDEIIAQVWGGRIVSDSALSSRVNAARKALGDDGALQRVIKTVHGRGFRFLPSGGNTPQGAVGLTDDDAPSIAVLPFDNLSGDPEQAFLAEGIAEDIITNLSRAPGLIVIARSSTTAAKDKGGDAEEAGRLLGVRYILQGGIRSAGDRLRLTARLIDLRTSRPIWAERYDRILDDVFELQDDMVREIVTALRIELSDGEIAALMNRGVRNIEAWRLLFSAHAIMYRYDVDSTFRAREMAQRACEIDPDYALAWSLLGLTYWYEARIGLTGGHDANLERSADYLEKAVSLDPEHPEIAGHYAASMAMQGRHREAVECCERNLAVNPGSANIRAYLGNARHWSGDHAQAIRDYEDAKRLNPLHPVWYHPMTARALDANGDAEAALAEVRAGLKRQPDNFPCLLQLVSLLGRRGEQQEAREMTARALLLSPGFSIGRVNQWLMMNDEDYVGKFCDGLRRAGFPE